MSLDAATMTSAHPGRLHATAQGLGWDLDGEIDRGMIEIVFIPQPDVMVEGHLLMMRERVAQNE